MLVCESLDRFMMLNEDFLAENVLNEKLEQMEISLYDKQIDLELFIGAGEDAQVLAKQRDLIVRQDKATFSRRG